LYAKQEASNKAISEEVAKNAQQQINDIRNELKALYPDINSFSISKEIINQIDNMKSDTVSLFVADFSKDLSKSQMGTLRNWLKSRIKADSLRLFIISKRKIQQI
jgi:DNA replication protein DnaD